MGFWPKLYPKLHQCKEAGFRVYVTSLLETGETAWVRSGSLRCRVHIDTYVFLNAFRVYDLGVVHARV